MAEPKPYYITGSDDDTEPVRHVHDCGELIGIEEDGVLIRGNDVFYSILMICPKCKTLVTWKADRLGSIRTKYYREKHGLLDDCGIDKLILSVQKPSETDSNK